MQTHNTLLQNPLIISQDYAAYTAQDYTVWGILYARQMQVLQNRVHQSFFDGLAAIGFTENKIPDFKEVNAALALSTGFKVVAVPGIVPDDFFFDLLAHRIFPASTWLRSMDQLDYLEEPDMFHDVFGHLPLLTNGHYCDFLQGLGQLAKQYLDNDWAIHLLSRVYWYTIEFGLISNEAGQPRIYGAGIISSAGESVYSLEEDLPRLPYDLPAIFASSYIKEKFQERYFVLQSFEELYHSLASLEAQLQAALGGVEQ